MIHSAVLYDKSTAKTYGRKKTSNGTVKKTVDAKMYQTPNILPSDTPTQRKEKIKNQKEANEAVKEVTPETKPSNRPVYESSDGQIRKMYTPEETGRAQIQTEEEVNKEKLEDLLIQTSTVLLKIETVFPFMFFPIKVIIDYDRVNIISTTFFFSERKRTIEIKDIKDVFVETTPFFAALKLLVQGSAEALTKIPYLRVEDALHARRLIQGLLTAKKEGIDLTKVEDPQLLARVEELGRINE